MMSHEKKVRKNDSGPSSKSRTSHSASDFGAGVAELERDDYLGWRPRLP